MAVLAVLYLAISYFMAAGVTKADREPLEASPSAYGLEFEQVEFSPRSEELALDGWYVPSDASGPSDAFGPTVILVHGHNSNREEDGDFLAMTAGLVDEGFNVLLFDLRSHGVSEGGKVSGGYYERLDVLGAFDYLVSRGVRSEQIGVLGFSMGAATALLGVADEPGIRAVVADSPYADVSDLIAQETARQTPFPEWLVPIFVPGMKPLARMLFGIDVGKLVPEEAVTALDFPILVIHGTGDERIPVEHGVRVHMASHRDSVLWLVPDVGHADAFKERPEEYVERVAAYFSGRLGVK